MMAVFDDAVGDLESLGVEIAVSKFPCTKHCMRERFSLQAEAFSWHRNQLEGDGFTGAQLV